MLHYLGPYGYPDIPVSYGQPVHAVVCDKLRQVSPVSLLCMTIIISTCHVISYSDLTLFDVYWLKWKELSLFNSSHNVEFIVQWPVVCDWLIYWLKCIDDIDWRVGRATFNRHIHYFLTRKFIGTINLFDEKDSDIHGFMLTGARGAWWTVWHLINVMLNILLLY